MYPLQLFAFFSLIGSSWSVIGENSNTFTITSPGPIDEMSSKVKPSGSDNGNEANGSEHELAVGRYDNKADSYEDSSPVDNSEDSDFEGDEE